jgi:hypothetical protein
LGALLGPRGHAFAIKETQPEVDLCFRIARGRISGEMLENR